MTYTFGPNRTHGTVSTYQCGCPCQACKDAGRAARAEYRRKLGMKPRKGFTHGTIYGYRWKECRCELCRAARSRVMSKCEVPSCPRKVASRGWCHMHYGRWRRNGDPLIKRRARGVMDAPVTPLRERKPIVPGVRRLTDNQRDLLVAMRSPVPIRDLAEKFGTSKAMIENRVCRIRSKFGYEVIITTIPRAQGCASYQLNPAVLR